MWLSVICSPLMRGLCRLHIPVGLAVVIVVLAIIGILALVGIFVGGQPPLRAEVETGFLLSPGSGDVTIDGNLLRGNNAGAGDGGGIRIASVNGHEVVEKEFKRKGQWYEVLLYNNMIDNKTKANRQRNSASYNIRYPQQTWTRPSN